MEGSWYVTAVENRCPACRQGHLFAGWLRLRETCEVCGARYERWEGSWTGPVVGGYGVGAGFAVLAILFLLATDQLVPGVEWAIAALSCVVTMAVYRPIKAVWIGMLYDWGYVFPDPPSDRAEATR